MFELIPGLFIGCVDDIKAIETHDFSNEVRVDVRLVCGKQVFGKAPVGTMEQVLATIRKSLSLPTTQLETPGVNELIPENVSEWLHVAKERYHGKTIEGVKA